MFIRIDNNNVIELQTLTNGITGAVDTGASVTVTLKDSSGTEVVGQSWPAAMNHDTGGTYRATLDDGLTLIATRSYTAIVDAVGTGGEVGHWEIPVQAITRNA